MERIFSFLGNIIPPKRICLNADVATHGYSLRAWRADGVYVATDDWKQALPLLMAD
jgi:hypothetical protein